MFGLAHVNYHFFAFHLFLSFPVFCFLLSTQSIPVPVLLSSFQVFKFFINNFFYECSRAKASPNFPYDVFIFMEIWNFQHLWVFAPGVINPVDNQHCCIMDGGSDMLLIMTVMLFCKQSYLRPYTSELAHSLASVSLQVRQELSISWTL